MSQSTSHTVPAVDADHRRVAGLFGRSPARAASPLAAAMLLCGSLLATPVLAETVEVPGIPNALPAVGSGNPLSALRVTTSGGAYALSSDISLCCVPVTESFEESNTFFVETGDYEQSIVLNKAAEARHGSVFSNTVASSQAELGKLRASVIATNSAGGYSASGAESILEFLDVISLTPAAADALDFELVLKVDGEVSAISGEGGATAWGQLWLFPFGPLPRPFAPFQAQFYTDAFYEAGQATQATVLGSTEDLPPGSSYWVYGRLAVAAGRTNDSPPEWDRAGTSYALFSDTAELFFTPAPGTPANSYTTASGFIYAAVPEPASVVMLAIGLLCIAMQFSRQRIGNSSGVSVFRKPESGLDGRWVPI